MLTYGSVCSGIEAASVAWEPVGMKPLWFSEIEPFPSAVLANPRETQPHFFESKSAELLALMMTPAVA
ncbi:hypothetical protein AC068_06970 [Morganella morganii]|nr:hypothetical protein AC068_06970 [Morganella morganii]